MMKVIIAGGREFNNYTYLAAEIDSLFYDGGIEIVSGMARGADQLGVRYAKDRGLVLHRFPANWEEFGKRAGFIRNEEMADNAELLIAFWDGESRGTRHMIETAKRKGLDVIVIPYKGAT